MKMILPFIALASAFLVSCGSTDRKPFPAQAPTGAETPLFNAINKIRLAEGKKPLKSSAKLDALAASESARLAESGSRKPDIVSLRSRAGYHQAAVIVGSLKYRGPQTGASYPDYWMKSKREKEYLLGDWYRVGTGTAKSKDGELVSIVIFGNAGGVSLMNPM
jgi:uncharacterized protein YkwD